MCEVFQGGLGGRGCKGAGGNFGGDGYFIILNVVMVAGMDTYAQRHQTVHFQVCAVKFIVCQLHLNKAVKETNCTHVGLGSALGLPNMVPWIPLVAGPWKTARLCPLPLPGKQHQAGHQGQHLDRETVQKDNQGYLLCKTMISIGTISGKRLNLRVLLPRSRESPRFLLPMTSRLV